MDKPIGLNVNLSEETLKSYHELLGTVCSRICQVVEKAIDTGMHLTDRKLDLENRKLDIMEKQERGDLS